MLEWAAGLAIAGAAGITTWAAVSPWSELFGPVLRRADSPGAMALTFDDGPNPAITPALLDLLERYGARGTFFMIGRHVRANPQLAAELVERGHAIGNHTDTHPNLIWLSPARIREELTRCQDAIGEATGLLLKVHTSNYRIVGFTSQVPAAELVALGREHGLPVMEDLGSGMVVDLSAFGLPQEPTVAEGVAAGIDVLTFSGDKLLGGPQAGLIVGKRWAIERIRRHPLARALRIDKLTLAALEATLRLYLDREEALCEIPVLRMLALASEAIETRCRALAAALRAALGEQLGPVVR